MNSQSGKTRLAIGTAYYLNWDNTSPQPMPMTPQGNQELAVPNSPSLISTTTPTTSTPENTVFRNLQPLPANNEPFPEWHLVTPG